MSLKCKIGLHSWNGCKCTECDKTRDEFHEWNGCKCSKCGKTNYELHEWNGCKCVKCGKTRNEHHDWIGCKCSRCGKFNDELHEWIGCKCVRCGKTRNEQHDWSKDCRKCWQCGKTRDVQHDWNGCKCSKCNGRRNLGHDWKDGKCVRCGKLMDAETFTLIGESKLKLGNIQDAISDFNIAIELDARYENAYFNRGTAWYDLGLYNDAISDYDKALEIQPSNMAAMLGRGNARYKIYDYRGALIDFTAFTYINHDYNETLSFLINKCKELAYQKYFQQDLPQGNGRCSWNACPCGGIGAAIPFGQGYLYIPESAVEFRKDCLTSEEFQTKLIKLANKIGNDSRIVFTDVPVLICDKGIKELDINPETAQEDAKRWWDTGLIPLRPSPKR